VKSVVAALTQKVQESTEALSAQNVSNALYGLQTLKGTSSEVRALLSVLTIKVQESSEVLGKSFATIGVAGAHFFVFLYPSIKFLLHFLLTFPLFSSHYSNLLGFQLILHRLARNWQLVVRVPEYA
jgi:hypothetical protein